MWVSQSAVLWKRGDAFYDMFSPLSRLKLRDELRPADIVHAQVLVIQSRKANVH